MHELGAYPSLGRDQVSSHGLWERRHRIVQCESWPRHPLLATLLRENFALLQTPCFTQVSSSTNYNRRAHLFSHIHRTVGNSTGRGQGPENRGGKAELRNFRKVSTVHCVLLCRLPKADKIKRVWTLSVMHRCCYTAKSITYLFKNFLVERF